MSKNLGLATALLAYVMWGLAPIYWKQIGHIDSMQVVAHRMLWSFVFSVIIVVIFSQWSEFLKLLRDPKLRRTLFYGSTLMAINWGIFIWAVNANHMVEVSMGYFINPLFTVLLGVIFFNESLRPMQIFALLIVVAGVSYLVFKHGYLPWIALSLAITFALYGVVKKSVSIPATISMAIEMGFFVVPALLFLLYGEFQQAGTSGFGVNMPDNLWLIFCGLMTLTPLILFASAAKVISLTALGMSQYIGPTLHLSVAIFLYKEPFDQTQFISFSLIWLALIIYTIDQLNYRRSRTALPV